MLKQAPTTASGVLQNQGKSACSIYPPPVRSLGCNRPIISQRAQPCSAKQPYSSSTSSLQEGQASMAYQQLRQPVPPSPQAEPPAGIPPPSNIQATVTLVPKKDASTALLRQQIPASSDADHIGKFLIKCKLAWNLFFPPQQEAPAAAAATPNLSPKELGKQRLQMILVADRCGLSPSSLVEMKRNTLAALADCMELEDLQDAHLRFTMTREGGTTYSMAVPILRPGPYADDGSVVGQAQPPSSAGAHAAMAAAAAAAGAYHADDYAEHTEDEYEYDDGEIHDGEYVAVEDATAAAAAAEPVGGLPDSWPMQQQQQHPEQELLLEPEPAATAAGLMWSEEAAALELGQQQQQQLEEGFFKLQLKELLVEELVHDVEDLALQADSAITGASAAAMLRGKSPSEAAAEGAAAEVTGSLPAGDVPGPAAAAAAGVLSEQELRAAAQQEVQKLVKQRQGADADDGEAEEEQ